MDNLWHALEITEVEDALDTDSVGGLTSALAGKRGKTKKSGDKIKTLRTFLYAFINEFADFTVIILAIAALLSFFVGAGTDAMLIIAITALNAVAGAVRVVKNSRITGYAHSLRKPYARVLRDGVERLIPAEEVVPGETIILKKGDMLCFEGRVVLSDGLCVKNEEKAERQLSADKLGEDAQYPYINMVYPGEVIASGDGRAIVCSDYEEKEDVIISTDIKEFGLHKKLLEVSRIVTAVIAVFCIGILTFGIIQEREASDMLIVSACLAAASVPNGLYSVVYSVLFSGAKMLSDKGITANSLYAVDALSSVDCICTDIKESISDNVYRAESAAIADKQWNLYEYGISDNDRSIIKMLFDFGVISSEVTDNGDAVEGHPVDVAIAGYAKSCGIIKNMLDRKYPLLSEKHNDAYDMVSVRVKDGCRVILKGNVADVLEKCSECVTAEGIADITEEYKSIISGKSREFSEKAMNVVAVAFKESEDEAAVSEDNFVFAGMIGVAVNPRESVVKTVAMCEKAGIKVVITDTGTPELVFAVAARSGIAKPDGEVLTGAEVEASSEELLSSKHKSVFSYSGMIPALKAKIVRSMKLDGYTVAVTGNMCDDAAELEDADIGISINHERCREISNKADIVTDKGGFELITEAIKTGRGIQANIRRVTSLVLTCGLSMLLFMMVSLMIFPEIPLLPVHILWISLIIDSLAAFALSCEPADARLMREKPRNREKSIFGGGIWKRIITQSVVTGVVGVLAYMCGRYFIRPEGVSELESLLTGRTMAFAVVSFSQLLNAFNFKSEYTLFNANLLSNIKLLAAFVTGVLVQVLIISVPGVNTVFGVCALSGGEWAISAALSLTAVIVSEIVKISTALIKRRIKSGN